MKNIYSIVLKYFTRFGHASPKYLLLYSFMYFWHNVLLDYDILYIYRRWWTFSIIAIMTGYIDLLLNESPFQARGEGGNFHS